MPRCDRLSPRQRDSLVAASVLLDLAKPGKAFQVPQDGKFVFDMNFVTRTTRPEEKCGAAGCILGLVRHIEIHANRYGTWAGGGYESCRNLFYPGAAWSRRFMYDYEKITPKMAAEAIRLFLSGEDDPFDEIDDTTGFRTPL